MEKKNKIFYLISGILGALFILLIILIKTGNIIGFDNFIYKLIINLHSDLWTNIFKFITFFGSTLFIVILVLLLFIVWRKNRGGQKLAFIIILSTIVNNGIKVIIRRPRPEVLRLVEEHTFSFPSGHTMAVTTLIGFLIYYIWKEKGNLSKTKRIILTILLIIYDLLVMISRIYLGAHFASDVIGGAICSTIIVLLTIPLFKKYFTKK